MTARGRKTNTGADSQSSSSTSGLAPDAAVAPSTSSTTIADLLVTASAGAAAEREEVKVNNASATEMKHACDDALKRVSLVPSLTLPEYPTDLFVSLFALVLTTRSFYSVQTSTILSDSPCVFERPGRSVACSFCCCCR